MGYLYLYFLISSLALPAQMRSRVCAAVRHPSICPIQLPHATALLLWARQPREVDRLLHRWQSAWCTAALVHQLDAGSATLSADVGS